MDAIRLGPHGRGLVKQAVANVETTKLQLTAAQLSVISDVAQAYVNLETADQKVTAASSEVYNAKEALRLAEGRYRSGVGVFLDVLDSQAALLTANTNLVNAQSGVNVARVALTHAIGEPVEAKVGT